MFRFLTAPVRTIPDPATPTLPYPNSLSRQRRTANSDGHPLRVFQFHVVPIPTSTLLYRTAPFHSKPIRTRLSLAYLISTGRLAPVDAPRKGRFESTPYPADPNQDQAHPRATVPNHRAYSLFLQRRTASPDGRPQGPFQNHLPHLSGSNLTAPDLTPPSCQNRTVHDRVIPNSTKPYRSTIAYSSAPDGQLRRTPP